MTVSAIARRRRLVPTPAPLAAAAMGASAALLLLRPLLLGLQQKTTLVGLAAIYCAVMLASFAVRLDEPGPGPARSLHVTAVGIAAVAVAAGAAAFARTPYPGAPALALSATAAVAEEAFFRKLLFDLLSGIGAGVAVMGSAAAFAAIHVPLYGWPSLPVNLAAGLLLSWQRWASGTWASPALTHVVANVVASL